MEIMKRSIRFLAVIKPAEEGGFYAYCPLLPGCASEGETYAETIANIEEAIRGYLEVALKYGDPLPEELFTSDYTVDIPVHLSPKVVNQLENLLPKKRLAIA